MAETTPTHGATIELENLTKLYPGNPQPAVDNVSMEIRAGETVIFVGPSGCGKSTTLKMINRLIEPTGGRIRIDGEDVTRIDPVRLRRKVGYAIQSSGLFPHMTVAQNIALVPKMVGWSKGRVRERVEEMLDLVGLDPGEFRDRYPRQLSGGQQQRVGVARALAADPPVLLMDEPFGAVDPVVRTQLQDELLRLQQELNKTIVFVTHDIDEAVRLGDRIAVFRTGGHLVQCAPPAELLARPADDFVADFLGAERGLKLLSLTTLADVPRAPAPEGGAWELVLDAARKPLAWRERDSGAEIPVRPLRDTDSLLSALNESIAAPGGLVARVDADGVLTGVTSRDEIHDRAGLAHSAAGVVGAA